MKTLNKAVARYNGGGGKQKKPAWAVLHGRLCIRRPGLFGDVFCFQRSGWVGASFW